jgi:tetratricopeptide (TPR) repeat protein
MSLKAELETWAAALKAYDEEDFDKALDLFSVRLPCRRPCQSRTGFRMALTLLPQTIADSSKILTNMGLIYATLGEHELATEQFNAATSLDNYLAVACVYFTSLRFYRG